MTDLDWDSLPPLRDVIATHDLRAEKKFGQNFLLDGNITDKIARTAGDLTGKTVFEIGPGPGGLTRSLLKAGARKVIAIEVDPRAVVALQDLKAFAGDRLEIMNADALKADLTALAPNTKRAIVANLPYNVATPLLIGWLEQIRNDKNNFDSMTLMFQKEVADRISAKPDTKAYGRLSILCQWLCNVQNCFILPPSAFTPPPKIKSGVVHFTPKTLQGNAPDFKSVGQLTAAAFGQRRKMLRSSLSNYSDALEKAGIPPTKRAENLTVEQFIQIASLTRTGETTRA